MYFKKSYRHCREKITSIHKTMYVEKRLDHCRGSSPRPYSNNPPDKIEVINDQEGLRSIKEITLRQRTGNLKKKLKTYRLTHKLGQNLKNNKTVVTRSLGLKSKN